MYMRIAAPVLHPIPPEVPSVTDSAPSPAAPPAVNTARQIVRAHISEENLPGLSVAVGIGGDLAWAEGFGYADIKSGTLVTPAQRFRIGTASPVLTSAAAGLLLQDGRLKQDEQIQTYVPAFRRKQWPVTLRQVMSHTAGIIPDGGDGSPLFEMQCKQPAEALPRFANRPLIFEPGTQYRSSPYDWILVSAAIEAAANQSFAAFVRERTSNRWACTTPSPNPGPSSATMTIRYSTSSANESLTHEHWVRPSSTPRTNQSIRV